MGANMINPEEFNYCGDIYDDILINVNPPKRKLRYRRIGNKYIKYKNNLHQEEFINFVIKSLPLPPPLVDIVVSFISFNILSFNYEYIYYIDYLKIYCGNNHIRYNGFGMMLGNQQNLIENEYVIGHQSIFEAIKFQLGYHYDQTIKGRFLEATRICNYESYTIENLKVLSKIKFYILFDILYIFLLCYLFMGTYVNDVNVLILSAMFECFSLCYDNKKLLGVFNSFWISSIVFVYGLLFHPKKFWLIAVINAIHYLLDVCITCYNVYGNIHSSIFIKILSENIVYLLRQR